MSSTSPILSLAWDKDGEYLAILQDGNGIVPLWSLSTRRIVPLETNLRDPTFFAWSKDGPQLAIGTAKGNLLIYNKVKKQKIPVVGKHSKRITCGSWSKGGNKLVLGAEDKTLTVSNDTGDTLLHTELRHPPIQAYFADPSVGTFDDDNIITVNLDGKSIMLVNIMEEHEDPMELAFAQKEGGKGNKHGDIVAHARLDAGSLLVGFAQGHMQIVSTNPRDIGEEKQAGRFHSSSMNTLAVNKHLKRVASAGREGVRVVNLRDFKEIRDDFVPREDLENGEVTTLAWSPDGQILTVATVHGNVYNFLAKMSVLNARYKTSVAYLSSLREVSIVDAAARKSRPIEVPLRLEPTIIALGPRHVAAGMNNRVFYHGIEDEDGRGSQTNETEYPGTVRDVQLNDRFAVVLVDSKAHVHPIDQDAEGSREPIILPSRKEGGYSRITCVSLVDNFLYYGTEAGTVEVFYLEDWVVLSTVEIRLNEPVKQIFPNFNGAAIVVVDQANNLFLFNSVAGGVGGSAGQSLLEFNEPPSNVVSAVWDAKNPNVIIVFDGTFIHTYVYVPSSMKGALLTKLGPVTVSSEGQIELNPDKVESFGGDAPILSVNGILTCQTMTGELSTMHHPFFDQLQPKKNKHDIDDDDPIAQQSKFCQALALSQLEQAWQAALKLDKRQFWLALSGKAMELLQMDLACRVYRQLGDAGMVMALQEMDQCEDKDLLAGHVSLLFCDYMRAQELFLKSSRPNTALEMRKDLMQWDQALKLAETLSAVETPEIYVKNGEQLESRGQITQALNMFESALNAVDDTGASICPDSLINVAMMGVARCQLRSGNVGQGIRLATQLDDKQLYEDSGDILEQQKQYSEAVKMFIKCQQYERAAFIYTKYIILQDKSRVEEAAKIMDKVDNDQIQSAFGKACVSMRFYKEAAEAYLRARDVDKVISIKLKHLDETQDAFDLVRQGASAQGALLVAEYCQERQDYRAAVEFLLLAGKSEEAFALAQTHNLVEVYTEYLGDNIGSEEALQVAIHYEKTQELGKAGRFYAMCQQYARALKLFIQCGDREIDTAIEVIGKSQDENLTHELIDFLVGEKDGVPKNPNYIYRLYMAMKKYEDAAKTALIIARQEQDMGNYALAHSVVAETVRCLEEADIVVSTHLRQQFVLLHSYQLSKKLIKSGDQQGAARMLLRVAQSVSKFPTHLVNILTSTIICCQRAGLKASAYEYAVMLMRPEYRSKIDNDDIKRKIEAIVRRSKSEKEELEEEKSMCPISQQPIPATELECPTTRDAIPMCIITGQHMLLDDWCICPNSKYPAILSAYKRYIQQEKDSGGEALDPVLGKPIEASALTLLSPDEASKYIQRYNGVIEKKPVEKEGEEGAGGEGGESKGGDAADNAKETAPTKESRAAKARAARKNRR
jgi:WD repeat-containing protein 19